MSAPRLPGERWECEACGEKLIGALSVNGKVSPITIAPKENGNVWLGMSKMPLAWDGMQWVERPDGTALDLGDGRTASAGPRTIHAVISGPLLEQLRAKNVGLHLNHFADCPNAKRFRS